MAFFEAVRLALQTIRAQKLKGAFSIVGVFIGVMFLIAVVSVVQGMNRYMTDKFAGTILGVNTFRLRQFPDVQLGNVTDSMWRTWARRPRVSYEAAQAVMRGVTVPVLAAWESNTRGTLTAGRRTAKDVQVTAATELYFDIRSLAIEQGRAFTGQEVQGGAPVLVLGHDLAEKLFEGQNPLGRAVKVFDIPYRVIGVVEKQGNLFGLSLDKFVVAPASAPLRRYVNPPRVVDALAMKAGSQSEMREAMSQAEATTLATVGASVGVGIGIALAAVVAATTPLPAAVAPWSIVVGVILGAGVGIIAGVYPATRAARLDPITALRAET